MASPGQNEANRGNAQKSTGPRTAAGKGAARLEAVEHGLRVQVFEVLPNEDSEAYQRLVSGWVRALGPRSEAELALVYQVAMISWKLNRADRHEAAILSRRVIDAVNTCACEDDDVAALRQSAAIASFDPSSEGERLRRYQFALMRELRHTIDAFGRLRKLAIAIAIATNEAISDEHSESEQVCGQDARTTRCTTAPNEAISAPDLARRESPDPAETDDRRSPLGQPSPQLVESSVLTEVNRENEPILKPEAKASARPRRDRWPLETLKKKQRHAKRLQKSIATKVCEKTCSD